MICFVAAFGFSSKWMIMRLKSFINSLLSFFPLPLLENYLLHPLPAECFWEMEKPLQATLAALLRKHLWRSQVETARYKCTSTYQIWELHFSRALIHVLGCRTVCVMIRYRAAELLNVLLLHSRMYLMCRLTWDRTSSCDLVLILFALCSYITHIYI